jgi:hypothetical protein
LKIDDEKTKQYCKTIKITSGNSVTQSTECSSVNTHTNDNILENDNEDNYKIEF